MHACQASAVSWQVCEGSSGLYDHKNSARFVPLQYARAFILTTLVCDQ